MWAVRRATNSNPLRGLGYQMLAARNFFVKRDGLSNGTVWCLNNHENGHFVVADNPLPKRFSNRLVYTKYFMGGKFLSSQARPVANGDEEGQDDTFSKLETPENVEGNKSEAPEEVDYLVSEPELSEEDDSAEDLTREHAEIDTSDSEVGFSAKVKDFQEKTSSSLSQLSEWLEASGSLPFTDRDYASRLDLVAKVRGIHAAELCLEKFPPNMQTELVYRTLLANYTSMQMLSKAEALFKLMKKKGFSLTAFSCNQLLALYKILDRKKFADVLLLMENENVEPTGFTYKILIDAKGRVGDYEGMEQVVEKMKSDGIVPDGYTQYLIASYYIKGRFYEKVDAVLKEMEGDPSKVKRSACIGLLSLYAALGRADDVSRIWKLCERNPRHAEFIFAIEAWGKLGKIENAEAVFQKRIDCGGKLPQRICTALLKVYTNHKLHDKAKHLVKRMLEEGGRLRPLTLDTIVKLYLQSGEVRRADSILQMALQQQHHAMPKYVTYLAILDRYAEEGDIHNAEKIFEQFRQAGYSRKVGTYRRLLFAYINAKQPAYGFAERLKADNILLQGTMASQLAQLNSCNKIAVAGLLE
ncbi:pentatricopeptide repeat-containing protein At1g80270, mitochondrial-like isoform X3 [Nymphaea colorata]|uniref:pentatricopeptide repeat-containing protein At1g80270, mitochondrial-like isoform X3 n=1 Tax=Nymphaea colorata TaxID=210225 RepID=UPI00129EB773|nr:pentatricopeptide repeat-containing protein At1g80270, mitochondrial-like isoform X3 [Nymphaea colorata]